MEAKIFISYRRTQQEQLRPVVDALRDVGLGVFFDLEDIKALADFPERIRDGLASSHAMLVWWSSDYAESELCMQELRLGWQHARRHSSNVARRLWIVNPEVRGDHIVAGELSSSNYLSPPMAGRETAWAQDLAKRTENLLAEGPLADEREAPTPVGSFGVPRSSERFTGRGHELWRIHSSLHPPQISGALGRPAVQLHGMGGVGKSELAAVYAEQFAAAYPGGVFWLNLAGYRPERPSLETAVSAWCEALGRTLAGHPWLTSDPPRLRLFAPDGKAMPFESVRAAIERLLGQLPSLWIIDNVATLRPDDFRAAVLSAWSAPSAFGRTLMTTRDGRPAAGFVAQELETLPAVSALHLMTRFRVPAANEQSAAKALIAEVGAHTLALTLLGYRLQQLGSTYRELLEQLRDKGRLSRIEQIAKRLRDTLGDKAQGIIATFETSITALSEPARRLLALAGCCEPAQPIPVALLADGYAKLLDTVREEIDLGDEIAASLESLTDANLLSKTVGIDDSLRIHPLLADAALPLLKIEYAPLRASLVTVLTVRIADRDDVRQHSASLAYIPHARFLVLREVDDDAIMTGNAEELINLALRTGNYARARGSYSAAFEVIDRALHLSKLILGEAHPYTLTAMNNLAETLGARGNLAEARKLQEQVLALHQHRSGKRDPASITALNNLAQTVGAQGDLKSAESMQKQALNLSQQVLGETHPDTLTAMNNLGETLRAKGDLESAEGLLEQALTMGRHAFGEQHPGTLTSMNNLAATYLDRNKPDDARNLLEEALATSRRLLGEAHPDTLNVMSNLAIALQQQGDLEGAINMHEALLTTSLRVLGEEHPDTLNTMSSLGETLTEQGNLDRAQALLKRVVETRQRVLGPGHPSTLTSMSNLAITFQKEGDFEHALALQQHILETRQQILGQEHPSTSLAAFNLFATLLRAGKQEDASEILRQHLLWLLTRDPSTLGGRQHEIQEDIKALL